MHSQVRRFKRDQIIEQAIPLFYERSYTGTTLDDIAQALGVTKPFIYSYFDNKTQLLSHVCRQGTEACLAVAQQAAKQEGTPTERLDWLIRNFADAVIEHERNIAIFFREQKHLHAESRHEISGMQKRFDQYLSRILEAGIAAGEFEVIDLRATTLAIAGLISWIYTWHRPGSRYPRSEISKTMAALVLRMVEKRVPAARP